MTSTVVEHATIEAAHGQITKRYQGDIPALMKYCALAVVSDGSHTRLGTSVSDFEYFYAWKKVENEGEAESGVKEVETMVAGALRPERLLEIFHRCLIILLLKVHVTLIKVILGGVRALRSHFFYLFIGVVSSFEIPLPIKGISQIVNRGKRSGILNQSLAVMNLRFFEILLLIIRVTFSDLLFFALSRMWEQNAKH